MWCLVSEVSCQVSIDKVLLPFVVCKLFVNIFTLLHKQLTVRTWKMGGWKAKFLMGKPNFQGRTISFRKGRWSLHPCYLCIPNRMSVRDPHPSCHPLSHYFAPFSSNGIQLTKQCKDLEVVLVSHVIKSSMLWCCFQLFHSVPINGGDLHIYWGFPWIKNPVLRGVHCSLKCSSGDVVMLLQYPYVLYFCFQMERGLF